MSEAEQKKLLAKEGATSQRCRCWLAWSTGCFSKVSKLLHFTSLSYCPCLWLFCRAQMGNMTCNWRCHWISDAWICLGFLTTTKCCRTPGQGQREFRWLDVMFVPKSPIQTLANGEQKCILFLMETFLRTCHIILSISALGKIGRCNFDNYHKALVKHDWQCK